MMNSVYRSGQHVRHAEKDEEAMTTGGGAPVTTGRTIG